MLHSVSQGCPEERSFFGKDSPYRPPTAHRQPPNSGDRPLLLKNASVVLCLAHVLTMKQRASLWTFVSVGVTSPFFFKDSPVGHVAQRPCRCVRIS